MEVLVTADQMKLIVTLIKLVDSLVRTLLETSGMM